MKFISNRAARRKAERELRKQQHDAIVALPGFAQKAAELVDLRVTEATGVIRLPGETNAEYFARAVDYDAKRLQQYFDCLARGHSHRTSWTAAGLPEADYRDMPEMEAQHG